MRKAHRQPLDRDIVHHLVVGALQEGRIDRRERLEAFRRQPAGEGHRVLLGNADVEGALGELLLEQVEPGARRHRRRDGDDPVVLARLLDQALAEHLGVLRRAALGFGLRAGRHVELDHAVILVGARSPPAHSPCPSASPRAPGSVRSRRRARCAAPAAGGRDCARRSARRNRSRAPRTACRRSHKCARARSRR